MSSGAYMVDTMLANVCKRNGQGWGRCSIVDELKLMLYSRGMPRQARIDASGALHHVVVRGIE